MKRYALIVAGGKGIRMRSETPKQFMLLKGKPILMHTLERFHKFDPCISFIVVLPANVIEEWKELCQKFECSINHELTAGGEHRFQSVKNGLAQITGPGVVAIHDGVRPLVGLDTMLRCFESAEKKGSGVPVLDINESVRYVDKGDNWAVTRTKYKKVQTPQVFLSELVQEAYQIEYDPSFSDDASVVDKTNHEINLVEGNLENIKITTPVDFIIAEVLFDYLIQRENS